MMAFHLWFLDTTRNHSRRWCSMRDCGNRVKVRRFYNRKRAAL
ncbi:MAG: CGNR zinc finger domain-containing protein [Bacillota bacterium]